MNFTLLQKLSVVLFLTIAVGCKKHFEIVFPGDKDVVSIPFKYTSQGHIVTQLVVHDDSLDLAFDTGADMTVLSTGIPSFVSSNVVNFYDLDGVVHEGKLGRVNQLSWGDLEFKNLACIVKNPGEINPTLRRFDGIIGGDLLRKFVVEIDNANQVIRLSSRLDSAKINGFKIPFAYDNNSINVKGIVDSKEQVYKLDCGFNGCFQINDSAYKSMLPSSNRKNIWINKGNHRSKIEFNDTCQFLLADLKLGEKIFNDCIFYHKQRTQRNLLGTSFLRRFKTVLIDYPGKNIYFQLPLDNSFMNFSGDEVSVMPVCYHKILYQNINSLGVKISNDPPFFIKALENRTAFNRIELGDTIVGIDDVIFSEFAYRKFWSSLKGKSCTLELSASKQKEKIRQVFDKNSEVILHLLKNDNLISIPVTRNNIESTISPFAFDFLVDNSAYFSTRLKTGDVYGHLPWASLSGKKVALTLYKNGKEQLVSN